jgi:hypothetical protein
MVAKIKDLALLGMFVVIIIMSLWPSGAEPCPEVQECTHDTTRTERIDTVEVPGPTKWKDTTIYVSLPYKQDPVPEQPPAVVNHYRDTLTLEDCQVMYNAEIWGELLNLNVSARRTKSRVLRITSTEFITREVERKVYPTRLYAGFGLGGNKQMVDDVSLSVLLSTKKRAYALDYDLIDQSLKAKVYFKLF